MLRTICLFALFVSACSFGSANLQSQRASDLESRAIRRIAVLPGAANESRARVPFSASASEARGSERETAELLARLVHRAMTAMDNWQIISESEVREAEVAGPAGDTRIKQIGETVYADAVMSGSVLRFRQRVGDDWGAKSPASVSFVLDLVDVRRGDVVWSARFDETQKSLTENFLGVFQIGERGLRWLSAEELTAEGVKKAVTELHQLLVKNPH